MYLWGLPVCWPRGFLSRGQCRQGLVPTRTWAMAQPGPSAPLGRSPCRGSWATADRELVFPSRSGNSGRLFQVLCLPLCFALPSLFLRKSPFCEKKKRERESAKSFPSETFPFNSPVSTSEGRKKVRRDKPKLFVPCNHPVSTGGVTLQAAST